MTNIKNNYTCKFFKDELYFFHASINKLEKDLFKSHSHSAYEILFFLRGDATFVSESNSYKLKTNDLLLISPNNLHNVVFDNDRREYERFSLSFPATFAEKIRFSLGCQEKVRFVRLDDASELVSIFNKLENYCNLYGNSEPETFLDIAQALLTELMYFVKSKESEIENPKSNYPPLLISILNYVDEHLFTIRSVTEINRAHYISYPYLIKLFKTQFNTTPKKYITSKRLIEAQKMIARGELPTHVFEKCGFENYNIFYRSYQSYFGHTPSQYGQTVSMNPDDLF